MDATLSSLLKSNGVHEDVTKALETAKCHKVEHFANWFDEAKDIKDFIASTPQRESTGEKAKLKHCWARAKELETRQIKRSAQGLADEPLDDPLPAEQQRDLCASAISKYKWECIDPRTIAADHLFAKIRREFVAWQPSMIELAKVRSLADAQRNGNSSKKHRSMVNDVTIIVGREDDKATHLTIVTFMHALEILCKTWIVTGNYDVPISADATTNRLMVELHEMEQYRLEFKMKIIELLPRFTEASIVRAMVFLEEYFRAKAIEKARSSQKIPWGKGLVQGTTENAHMWAQAREYLVDRYSGNPGTSPRQDARTPARLPFVPNARNEPRTPRRPSKGSGAFASRFAKGGGKGRKGKEGRKGKDNIKWYKEAAGEARFCMYYNRSSKGCSAANCQDKHACNAVLENGTPCGKKHPRVEHVDSLHGKTQRVGS